MKLKILFSLWFKHFYNNYEVSQRSFTINQLFLINIVCDTLFSSCIKYCLDWNVKHMFNYFIINFEASNLKWRFCYFPNNFFFFWSRQAPTGMIIEQQIYQQYQLNCKIGRVRQNNANRSNGIVWRFIWLVFANIFEKNSLHYRL